MIVFGTLGMVLQSLCNEKNYDLSMKSEKKLEK